MGQVQNTKRRSGWLAYSIGGGRVALGLVGSSGQLLRVMDMEYSMPILGACGTCRYAGGDVGVGRSGSLHLWGWTLGGTREMSADLLIRMMRIAL